MTASRVALIAALCAVLVPATSHAQTATANAPLKVEPLDSGFVIAPEARFGEINGKFATLAGAYGGWVTDHKLLIGGAGYWLANREDDFEMQDFGGLARWTLRGQRALGVSFGAFAGFGNATLSRSYGELFGERAAADLSRNSHVSMRGRQSSPFTSATLLRVNDDFFIIEPQVDALWRITRWMRLDAGVGYRGIAGADLLHDQLRGVSGSIGVRFGGQ